jgi:hypothetical protein
VRFLVAIGTSRRRGQSPSGIQDHTVSTNRGRLTAGFKREAVRLMQTSGKPAAVVDRGLGTSLKQELTHHVCFKTRDEVHGKVFDYIEVVYNRQRLYSSPGYCHASGHRASKLSCLISPSEKAGQLTSYQFPIRGTLNERTCLPELAATRADGMRRFRVGNCLNEAVSSNVPGRSYIRKKRWIVHAVWHYSIAKHARRWVTGDGNSRR